MRKIINGLLIVTLLTFSNLSLSASSYYGPTLENEHLYRIALRVSPSPNLAIQQVMIAILNANPEAFNGHNINGLKSGYRLRIPSFATILHISPQHAMNLVQQQNLAWKRGNMAESKILISKKIKPKIPSKPVKDTPKAEKTTMLDLIQEQKNTEKQAETNSTPTSTNQEISNTEKTIDAMDQKLNNIAAQTQKFEQQASTQLFTLEKQNRLLEAKVNQLTEELRTVTYRFIQLTSKVQPHERNYSAILANLKANTVSLSIGFLSLLLLTYLLTRSFRAKPVALKNGNLKDDEYDYLNSEENIPSKLDLARAYIDMGDYNSAEVVLKEVITRGNKEQREGATALLEKMNKAP